MHHTLWLRAMARALGVHRLSPSRKQRRAFRRAPLVLEHLEERVTPSTVIAVNDPSGGTDNPANVTVATLGDKVTLRDAVNAANNSSPFNCGPYIINLPSVRAITFNTVDNNWYGANALPAITSNITVHGSGDTLRVSGVAARFFYVSGGPWATGGALPPGALELDDLTLQGGLALESNGGVGAGGAIYNQGELTLRNDTLTNNKAQGGDSGGNGDGAAGLGGGIFNMLGTLTVINSTFSGNTAQGSNGNGTGTQGGSGFGGALFNVNGTATLTYATIANNSVLGGTSGGSPSGNANGGGVYNLAEGGTPGLAGNIATLALVNSVIGQDQNNNGDDLVNDAENGAFTNTARILGSSSLVQGGALQTGNGINLVAPGAITRTDAPLLASDLAYNGGATETLAPLAGSPVFGAGNGSRAGLPRIDQRGLPRPNATSTYKSDDGAFQTQTTTTTVSNVTTSYASAGQVITLTATVDDFGERNLPVGRGQVAFTLVGTGLQASGRVNGSGVARVSLFLPSTLSIGSYTIAGTYSDQSGPYSASNGTGTLSIQTTATSLSTIDTNSPIVYNSGGEALDLQANVASSNGDAINEGVVVFTVNGVSSGPIAVNGGVATTMLVLPMASVLLAGAYPNGISASYTDAATNHYASAVATGPVAVNAATTTTAITSTLVLSTYNSTAPQQVTLTAAVTSGNGDTINEGNVLFTLTNPNGTNLTAIGSVGNGTATATLTLPASFAAGNYDFNASYSDTTNANGVTNYVLSTAATPGTLIVNTASTATATPSSLSTTFNSLVPQAVTLTTSVTSSDGGTVNEGTVTFTVVNPNGADLTATAAVGNGTATATLTVPADFAAGTYAISASYADITNANGTVNYLGSSSPSSGVLTVNAAATQTILVSTALSSTFNSTTAQTVTLIATVTSADGGIVNEGVVTFIVVNPNRSNLTAIAAVSNDLATTTLTLPAGFAAGSYILNTSYADSTNANGSVNYLAGASPNSGTLTVNAATTTTAITTPAVGSTYDSSTTQSVTLSAAVASSNGGTVNEGNVTFTLTNPNGSNLTATGSVTNGAATATLTLPAGFAAGSYAFTANYADTTNANGSVNYLPNPANSFGTLIVHSAATQTAITSTAVRSTYNSITPQIVTLTAAVTSSNGDTVNEGIVTFVAANANGPSLTTTASVSGGTATATLSLPAGFAAGSYTFTAGYTDANNANGIPNFATRAAAAPGLLIVNATGTATAIVSSSAGVVYNSASTQSVSLTASVLSATGGTVNEGAVTFTLTNPSGPNLTATANVASGSATATLTVPPGFAPGTYSFTARYVDGRNANGVVNYQASASATPGALNLNTAGTQTGVVVSPATVSFTTNGQSVTVAATVSSSNGGPVNEGAVTFALPGATSATVAVNAAGQALAMLNLPPGIAAGNYPVTASYTDTANGSARFATSSGVTVLTMAQAPTTINIREVVIVPFGGIAVEVVTALVSSAAGVLDGSMVSFNVDGAILHGAVQGGQAVAWQIVPLPLVVRPLSLGLSLSPFSPNFAASTETELVLSNILNAFNFGYVVFGADGSQVVAFLIDGIPVGLAYNAQGQFTGFALGILPVVGEPAA